MGFFCCFSFCPNAVLLTNGQTSGQTSSKGETGGETQPVGRQILASKQTDGRTFLIKHFGMDGQEHHSFIGAGIAKFFLNKSQREITVDGEA